MDLVITLAATSIIAIVYLTLRRRQHGKPVPGPRPLPFLGNVHQMKPKRVQVTLYEWMQAYGDIVQFTVLGQKYVILNSAELNQSVLHKYIDRPFNILGQVNHDTNGATFGNNIFVRNELKHGVIDIVQDKTMKRLSEEQVRELINTLREAEGRDVTVNTLIERTVQIQVLISLIGCKPTDADIDAVGRYLETARDMFSSGAIFVFSTFPWLRFIPGTPFKRVYDSNKTAIVELVRELTKTGRKRENNFNGLIAQLKRGSSGGTEQETLTDLNVHAIIVDVVAGSIGPWFTNILGGILLLAKLTSVQKKLHSEMDKVCQNKNPSLADRDRLPYLNATVLEIYRYLSILTLTVPHLATEDTEINGFFVEKGTTLYGCLSNLNHSETVWNDAWVFRPERFIDESGNILSSKHALPFGTGPRMCTGEILAEPSVFIYLANILYHFVILPPTSGDLPDYDPRTFNYGASLMLAPVHCRFEPRR